MKNFALFTVIFCIVTAAVYFSFASEWLARSEEIKISLLFYEAQFRLNAGYLAFAPLLLYAALMLLGLFLASFRARIERARLAKDVRNFDAICADLLLFNEPAKRFKSPEFRKITPLLAELASGCAGANATAISAALAAKNALLAGEFVQAKISKNSAFFAKNQANLLANDLSVALKTLKNCTQISTEAEALAYQNALQHANYAQLKPLARLREAADCALLIDRAARGNLALSGAELQVLLASSGFSAEQFVAAAKSLRNSFDDAALLAIFAAVAAEREEAARAHWLLLAELGLWDELRAKVHEHEAMSEDFSLLIFLHDANKFYEPSKLIF